MSTLLALQRFVLSGAPPCPSGAAEALALVETAKVQGLAGLLDDALTGTHEEWPPAARRALRQAHRAAAFRGEQLLDLTRRARALLGAAGIRTLPMKGIALLGFAYDAPAERPMDDVDLLVLEGWEDALARLQAAGFGVLERADHAWALRDPCAGLTLELHRGLASCPEMFPIDGPALWSRRAGSPGEERPSSEDLLVQLSVHAAFQHGLRLRLVQFLDFRRVLERTSIDPAKLLELARAARAEGSLLAALEAAAVLVAAPVGETLLAELRRLAPARLRRKVEAMRREPMALLAGAPSPRTLAGWRLALVGARRLQLVARTLAPSRPERREGALERLRRAGNRGLDLFRRLRRSAPRRAV